MNSSIASAWRYAGPTLHGNPTVGPAAAMEMSLHAGGTYTSRPSASQRLPLRKWRAGARRRLESPV